MGGAHGYLTSALSGRIGLGLPATVLFLDHLKWKASPYSYALSQAPIIRPLCYEGGWQ